MTRGHIDEALQEQCVWVRGAPAAVAFLIFKTYDMQKNLYNTQKERRCGLCVGCFSVISSIFFATFRQSEAHFFSPVASFIN